jgi:hypothetical protein
MFQKIAFHYFLVIFVTALAKMSANEHMCRVRGSTLGLHSQPYITKTKT